MFGATKVVFTQVSGIIDDGYWQGGLIGHGKTMNQNSALCRCFPK